MTPDCSANLADVFSPSARAPNSDIGGFGEAVGARDPHFRPPVNVDDRFFFRCELFQCHRLAISFIRRIPLILRLGAEFCLIVGVFTQVTLLIALHAPLVPSPIAPQTAGALAEPLAAALPPHSSLAELPRPHSVEIELLRVEVEVSLGYHQPYSPDEFSQPSHGGHYTRRSAQSIDK
eukprot:gnl/TRDRNA2_/TRDRNA2_175167_c0_seq1.p1 gnl/TRDRNA2_/TRDRNA2_175167_c0~~gnl/TRDRNA2_/TRDRNA2_175167_c0_seq1.p1  ORF type:complete len:178 (-),score=18.09 gnl/TRDRNA2_/TRDRNA2_175167_c0_seq1:6-539(-)